MRCKARTPFIFRCLRNAVENSPYCLEHQNYPPSGWRSGLLTASRIATGVAGAAVAVIGFACLRNCPNKDLKDSEEQLNAAPLFDYAVLGLAIYEAKTELHLATETNGVKIFMTPAASNDIYFSRITEPPDWMQLSAPSRRYQLPEGLSNATLRMLTQAFVRCCTSQKTNRKLLSLSRGPKVQYPPR